MSARSSAQDGSMGEILLVLTSINDFLGGNNAEIHRTQGGALKLTHLPVSMLNPSLLPNPRASPTVRRSPLEDFGSEKQLCHHDRDNWRCSPNRTSLPSEVSNPRPFFWLKIVISA